MHPFDSMVRRGRVATAGFVARAAQEVAKETGLKLEVRGPREIAALRMGMFQGVTRGSAEEPRLVKLSWLPRGAAGKKAPLVLVGKAITFDSVGQATTQTISPSDNT